MSGDYYTSGHSNDEQLLPQVEDLPFDTFGEHSLLLSSFRSTERISDYPSFLKIVNYWPNWVKTRDLMDCNLSRPSTLILLQRIV